MNAFQYTIEERNDSAQWPVAVGIWGPCERRHDFDFGKLGLDCLNPLLAAAAQNLGCIFTERKRKTLWLVRFELRCSRLRSPSILTVLFGIQPKSFQLAYSTETRCEDGIVLNRFPVVIIRQVGCMQSTRSIHHSKDQEVVG